MATFIRMRLAMLLLLLATGVSAWAVTPAGTIIKNQASASYRDSNGVMRTATSNLVETLIQQVAALELFQSQTRIAAAGQQVFFPHTLTNTGNGTDSFSLSVSNAGGDDFDYTLLAIYDDSDQDGLPDSYTAVTVSPGLGMQEQWHFVVAASVPAGQASADAGVLNVAVQSQFNSAITATNTDTTTLSADAVIELGKSISATSGTSPGGSHTVTLTYRNTGSANANNVTLIDALPSGMTYVPSSGRWSDASAVILSDNNPNDAQGSGNTINYCAYHSSCIGLAEADSDIDSDSTNQVTAVIASVAPGDVGSITFDVNIDSGLDTQSLVNTGEFEYATGGNTTGRQQTNSVAFTVLHGAAVVLNGSASVAADLTAEPATVASMPQATSVFFENYVWNTGNGTDTFDITLDNAASNFPAGTLFRVLQQDGLTPLIDTSGNGLPDTGPLPPGTFYKVMVQAIPPANAVGNNGGAGFTIAATATSVFDAGQSNPMVNNLLAIAPSTVDITNFAVVADTDSAGDGIGPETDPVVTVDANPGETVTIDLYINNTGPTPGSLDLAASIVDDFATIELPADWTVTFRLDGEAEAVTNTGLINPGEHVLVHADVEIPVTQVGGEVSLYFRALTEATGSLDIIHDSINVVTTEQVLLVSDQTGQADPGGSYIYNHSLSATGNATVNNLQLSTQNDVAGWTSIVYEDTDNSGDLTAADTPVSVIPTLAPGQVIPLFVRVFVPASAELLSVNNTTLTASWNGGADSVAATDVTRVTESELSIVKEQAPDLGCDGALDGSYGVGSFSVEPGNNCVSYRLTARNDGSNTVYNVDIADATPAFTSYTGTAVCAYTGCSVTEPVNGGYGNIVATLPSLVAGASVVLTFSVRVE
jgi:uncharacterized repeat protein (TIGR01451 family)